MNIRTTTLRTPRNIALFVGSDISSHLLINKVVPELVFQGYSPFVYFVKQRNSKTVNVPELLRHSFFERTLINRHVYPFLDERPIQRDAQCHSPRQLAREFNLTVKEVNDINEIEFIKELEAKKLEVGISVRCYQKFGNRIIDFFSQRGHKWLWNLHPGILPDYQGVMTLFRAMYDGRCHTSYSLHIINEDWDDGPLIDVRPQPLDLQEAMQTNYCILAPSGVAMIIENLNKISEGIAIEGVPQTAGGKRYYTFPTQKEIDAFLAKGLRLVDPGAIRSVILSRFSVEGTRHHDDLARNIDQAVYEYCGIRCS